ncbi:glycoside hydrolase family 5 protein [Pseudoduganella namucuonensis]|uniref:Endoglucanase n=1 Tax=Pseudoduganella namucuonensis TaxID=1035707 RepID=A0A1I7LUM9_9BURK|nr:glycoside hydrolase family 5 protein [Pseudoduganella namucuonensis]SFV13300.1 endoglucanase [Pseudoduganella namucuonensis]
MKQSFYSMMAAASVLLLAAGFSGCSGGAGGASSPAATTPTPTPTPTPTTAGMRDMSSTELAKLMSPGINLGNTLEAIPNETAWGNPVPTQALMNAYKAAGFKTVRIPIAWSQYADANNNISATWLAHVRQVVDYAHNAGLYTMINIHWDGGWMNHPTYDKQAAINAKLAKFWTQIANTFKNDDDTLLFAGSNEVGQENFYGTPSAEWTSVQNSFNQTFVDAVRATGGNNAVRHLVVQGYNTNIDITVATNTVPKDTVANRLFMEVHYYDPFHFTLDADSKIWQWGATATDPAAVEPWANEAWADAAFQKMKTAFGDKGVPVILGEYGAGMKAAYPGMNAYHKLWNQYITRSAFQRGLVPVYWDTGGMIDRKTGAHLDPDVIEMIVKATK